MININCTSYALEGKCLHQAAPRRLLGPANCIVWEFHAGYSKDPRVNPTKCALCTPVERPTNTSLKPIGQPNVPMVSSTFVREFDGR